MKFDNGEIIKGEHLIALLNADATYEIKIDHNEGMVRLEAKPPELHELTTKALLQLYDDYIADVFYQMKLKFLKTNQMEDTAVVKAKTDYDLWLLNEVNSGRFIAKGDKYYLG